jgi:hypothetical protein
MVPNLLVTDSNPGLTGFIIVKDDRDSDNILARKVPSVVYSDNDLVNVLFVRGGEAIAFQQGSQSQNSGIWEIVPSTSTDIFYDKGDVGIGKAVAPDATLEILDTAQAQLRLTHTEDTKFADFTLDTNHDLTIKPSSTGQIILQPTTDSTDFFQVLDADGGDPILNVDATNERVGIGTATPDSKFEILDTAGAQLRLSFEDAVKFTTFEVDTNHDLTITPSSDGEIVLQQRTITAAGGAHRAIRIEPTYDGSGSGQAPIGIVVTHQPSANIADAFGGNYRSVADPGVGVTITRTSGNLIRMDTGDNGAITQQNALRIEPASYGSVKPVTARGVHIRDQAAAGITTAYGIHVEAQTGATNNYAAVLEGDVGIGVDPQGILHTYDAIAGSIIWKYDGLNATVRTIIANGSGDCLYRLHASYVLRDSAAAVASGTTDVSNSASVNLTVGGNTVRLRVNADGSVDVARTAGTDTIKVAFKLLWL